MPWDYAELSKAAKEAGGPERLIAAIEENAKSTGRREMIPLLLLFAAGAYGVAKLVDYFNNKKSVSEAEAGVAKKELIQEIKQYDAEHKDEKSDSETLDNNQ